MRNRLKRALERLTYWIDRCLYRIITGKKWPGNIEDWRNLP